MPSPFDDIFGSSGPQWTTDQITARIRGEAQKQGVDPDLALALATQESYLNPNAKGDNGKSIGLFKLQEAAAKDAGINPQWRDDPGINIYGGIRYFKMKLDQSKGNVDEALSRYNRGTPDYRGIGDPNYVQNVKRFLPGSGPQAQVQPQAQAQRPGMMARVASVFSPASAEASTPQQEATGTVWDDIFGGQQATPQPAAAPQPPTARSTPEQDAAYRASRSPQGSPPAAQTTPVPVTQPGASQGPSAPRLSMGDPREAATEPEARATIEAMRTRQTPALERFLALPSIAQLTPAERQQVQAEFQALPPDQQEQVIQQEVPQDLQQAMAKPQASYPRRVGETPRPGEKRLGTPDEAPLEEGITKPSTLLPLVGGFAAPGLGAKVGMRLVPEAWRWVGRIGGETALQAGTELAGKALETGKAPDWQEIAATTAWNLAPQAIEEGGRATFRNILRSGQGARTILSDVAAQESKGLGRRVFHPQDEQVLSKMFEDVKASGVKLDIDPVTDLMTSLKPEQRQVLLRDVKAISSPLAAALQKTGQPGALRLTGWDIGDLQTLRSDLIKRSQAVRTPERQDLINEMRMAVDDAIERGMAVGSTAAGGNPETLRAAQAGWRRLRQSDDLQALVTKHTNYSPNLQYQDLNLAALRKSLDGTNPLGRKVAGSLGKAETEALQQELTTLAKRYPFVKVPNTVMNFGGKAGLPGAAYLALTGNMPGAAVAASSAVVALALQSPKAMSYFRSAIVNGKGRLSSNDVAAIVNAVRQVSDVEEPG